MNEEFRIICDGGDLRIYKGDYGFNFEEIVDLLNEQQITITELEKNFNDLVNWASEIAKRNVVLDEQIGRLQIKLQKKEEEKIEMGVN